MSDVMHRTRSGPEILLALLVCLAPLSGCSGGGGGNGASQPPPTLTVTTTSLPPGRVGVAYAATLAASGGQAPISWALTAGTLPAGLTSTAAGAISGTPTATAAAVPVTFTVTDSKAQQKSVTLKLNVSPANITVSVSPARAGLTVTQTLTLAATTNDYAGVTRSVSPAGGSFSAATSTSGTNTTFTAPATAGVYTLTATSATNSSVSAALTVGVTDLAGVYTYHHDSARDGANTQEYALTPTNVNTATFGKLFSCTVDGAVYAQPLWVANLTVGGTRHNVIFVATAHDSLYAFDADLSPCQQLWHVSLIDVGHGATAGEVTVPSGPTNHVVGLGSGDITPEVGVIGTPVVDPVSGILYVVSKSMNAGATLFYQRLHAIDITTGNEKPGSPIAIAATYPGTGGNGGTSVTFSPQQQNQRAGLALVSGTVYIAWGSHEDTSPWWGWLMSYTYNGAALQQSSVLNVVPNTSSGGGIWMSGGAPAADVNGSLYVITGNGGLDAKNSSSPTNDYGDCFLQLNGALGVTSWFAPSDEANDAANDGDFGSGGAALVLNLLSAPAGMPRHLVLGGGKDGVLVLLNGDNLGRFSSTDAGALQSFNVGVGGIYGTAAFWNNTLYLAPAGASMLAYAFDPSGERFTPAAAPVPTSQSAGAYGFPGSTPAVSATGAAANGIVWALNNITYCTSQSPGCGPAVLHAYDATNLGTELWNSRMVAADAAGNAVKFTVPTVANGKVYVGTRGNNTGGVYGSTTISGELEVYGLKPD
ncbi:MAG TPA: putative Ig domain-containing protein [Steroidobacteraceae bacterium]|nr:putative Ig domain-containing protein [Steroidobacteraceae bacterium]